MRIDRAWWVNFWLLTVTVYLLAGGAGRGQAAPGLDLVAIPGTTFTMGDREGEPDEVERVVTVGSFRMMRHEVTNAQFSAFVKASGHVTDPERSGAGYVWKGRWTKVRGADWRRPFGPDSVQPKFLDEHAVHPVLQTSQRDATAFCTFYGLRLPSDEEWELAARGTDRRRYPWGNTPPEQSGRTHYANFGTVPCCAPDTSDGHEKTAPVGRYPAGRSPYGLTDMAGNV